jgi:polysaccharide pyruvyl transferase WcaK-like protein
VTSSVGISGSYGGFNLGDEAILQSIITQHRESVPVNITVFSRNAEDTIQRHQVEKVVSPRELTLMEVTPEIENLDLFILGEEAYFLPLQQKFSCVNLKLLLTLAFQQWFTLSALGPLRMKALKKKLKQPLARQI